MPAHYFTFCFRAKPNHARAKRVDVPHKSSGRATRQVPVPRVASLIDRGLPRARLSRRGKWGVSMPHESNGLAIRGTLLIGDVVCKRAIRPGRRGFLWRVSGRL